MIGLYFIPGGLLAVAYIHIVIVLWRNQIPGAVECSKCDIFFPIYYNVVVVQAGDLPLWHKN